METYDYVYIQMYSFKTNNCFLPAHYVTWLAAPDRSETGMFIVWTVHVLTAGFTLGMASANERRCLSLAETIPRMIPELYLVANKLCAQLTINQISDFCFFHLDHYLASFICFQITKSVGSLLMRHRSDTSVLDRYLIDINPRVFPIWVFRKF